MENYLRYVTLIVTTLCLVGCSTPPLEYHGQTRFEQKQKQGRDF